MRTTRLLALLVVPLLRAAYAADTDPLDFDYTLAGDMASRPALVFNDGRSTYLQPRAGQTIKASGAEVQGPYLVLAGTPMDLSFDVNGKPASAHWNRLNQFAGQRGSSGVAKDDQPAGFTGFSDHLTLIGTHGQLETVRALTLTLPVASIVKTLVPQGWSGSAERGVDLSAMRTFTSAAGENWVHALDRLLGAVDLFASVDFDAMHVRISALPPKSNAVNYAGSTAVPPAAAKVNTAGEAGLAAPNHYSLLASVFGAQAIRDGDDTHTQIRFAAKPEPMPKVLDQEGRSLHPKWDELTKVLTIDRSADFFVSNEHDSVEVARVDGMIYDFAPNNAAHLEAVFDQDNATYFKFGPTVVQASVTDITHAGTGEQKGQYYKFDGIASDYIATGDGQSVTVKRRHDVRYFDRKPEATK